MTIDLSNKVMLVDISISVFSGEKIDRKVSDEIADAHSVDSRTSGRYSKQIISKHALESIKKLSGAARTEYYRLTLPWSDMSGRLLSTVGYLPFCDQMRVYRSQFLQETERFITAYPDLIEEARQRLNGMFDIGDYPPIEGLRSRFVFKVNSGPLPDAKNWLLDLASDEMDRMKQDVEERMSVNFDGAVKEVYRRIADVTGKMAEKLTAYEEVDQETGKPKTGFHATLVENVRGLVDILPSLNITEDPKLTELAEEMQSKLCKFDAATLKVDGVFRKDTAKAAADIFNKVAGLF